MRLKSWSGRQGVCCRHRVSIRKGPKSLCVLWIRQKRAAAGDPAAHRR